MALSQEALWGLSPMSPRVTRSCRSFSFSPFRVLFIFGIARRSTFFMLRGFLPPLPFPVGPTTWHFLFPLKAGVFVFGCLNHCGYSYHSFPTLIGCDIYPSSSALPFGFHFSFNAKKREYIYSIWPSFVLCLKFIVSDNGNGVANVSWSQCALSGPLFCVFLFWARPHFSALFRTCNRHGRILLKFMYF